MAPFITFFYISDFICVKDDILPGGGSTQHPQCVSPETWGRGSQSVGPLARSPWQSPLSVAFFCTFPVGPVQRQARYPPLGASIHTKHLILRHLGRTEAPVIQDRIREAPASVPPRDDRLRDRPPSLLPLRGVQVPRCGVPFPEGSESHPPVAAPSGLLAKPKFPKLVGQFYKSELA